MSETLDKIIVKATSDIYNLFRGRLAFDLPRVAEVEGIVRGIVNGVVAYCDSDDVKWQEDCEEMEK